MIDLPSGHVLQPFPGWHHPKIRISAETSMICEQTLRSWFVLEGDLSQIVYPAPGMSRRADGLWRHTCFELFIGTSDRSAYVEINLTPSLEWAAYQFEAYRAGMRELTVTQDMIINTAEIAGMKSLGIDLDLSTLLDSSPTKMNLSAVIEETSGRKSYWALAHPPGAPDFHHPDCFVLDLPPPERP